MLYDLYVTSLVRPEAFQGVLDRNARIFDPAFVAYLERTERRLRPGSDWEGQACARVAEAAELDVALVVDVGVGGNWDEAH